MAASVATVSAGQGAKPSVAVCRCVHVPCRSVCLCLCVLRHVACGMVARVHGDAMRSLRLSLRSYAECHQTAKGQKRFVPASKTRRHKQHTHASQSVSLSLCQSVSLSFCLCAPFPILILSLSLSPPLILAQCKRCYRVPQDIAL